MKVVLSLTFLILLMCGVSSCRHSDDGDLASQISTILSTHDVSAGVAVIINDSDTVVVNNNRRYPLMSVFKFHQALAVCDAMARKNCGLDSLIHVNRDDLQPDTYSPLRDDSVAAEFDISVATLLDYTMQLSDNNACDILFDRIVGVKATDDYIRTFGINDFAIAANEDDMHKNPESCRDNWSSPLALAELFDKFYHRFVITGDYYEFMYNTMIRCHTGADRLALPLAQTGAIIGHKTGTSDRDSSGRIIAVNDAGFVELPDGQHYTIAVLVSDSGLDFEATAAIIADISAVVYACVTK